MSVNTSLSGDSTPKTTPTVRHNLGSIFHYQRTVTSVDDRHVTKRSDTKKSRRCPSPYHATCSCPSIVQAVNETPTTSFEASLRNYDSTPKRRRRMDLDKKSPQSVDGCMLETANFVVGVRMRPFNAKELDDPNVASVIDMDSKDNSVHVRHANNNAVFEFDYVFNGINDQENVYNKIGSKVLDFALDGYNVCLFAYGQTGSGKTYSIIGTPESPGIVPRFGKDLFERVSNDERADIELSYCEIYNEKIYDLLSNAKKALNIRQKKNGAPYVVDLSSYFLDSNEDFQSYIALGNTRRVTGENGVNEHSSRAHAICTVSIRQNHPHCPGTVLSSKINIVDLAGSERASAVKSSGKRLREGVAINQSLLTLRKVITKLAERNLPLSKSIHIPYRESVLTRLLSESLGENSRTFMLATISPSPTHVDETMLTLQWACRSRKIVNFVKVNEDPKDVRIKELLYEIEFLKSRQKEFDDWERDRRILEEKRQLISEYETEIEELRCLLDRARRQVELSLVAQSKHSIEISQQMSDDQCSCKKKKVETNTSHVERAINTNQVNGKQLFMETETKSSSDEIQYVNVDNGETEFTWGTFASEFPTVIQKSQSVFKDLNEVVVINAPENKETTDSLDITNGSKLESSMSPIVAAKKQSESSQSLSFSSASESKSSKKSRKSSKKSKSSEVSESHSSRQESPENSKTIEDSAMTNEFKKSSLESLMSPIVAAKKQSESSQPLSFSSASESKSSKKSRKSSKKSKSSEVSESHSERQESPSVESLQKNEKEYELATKIFSRKASPETPEKDNFVLYSNEIQQSSEVNVEALSNTCPFTFPTATQTSQNAYESLNEVEQMNNLTLPEHSKTVEDSAMTNDCRKSGLESLMSPIITAKDQPESRQSPSFSPASESKSSKKSKSNKKSKSSDVGDSYSSKQESPCSQSLQKNEKEYEFATEVTSRKASPKTPKSEKFATDSDVTEIEDGLSSAKESPNMVHAESPKKQERDGDDEAQAKTSSVLTFPDFERLSTVSDATLHEGTSSCASTKAASFEPRMTPLRTRDLIYQRQKSNFLETIHALFSHLYDETFANDSNGVNDDENDKDDAI